MGGERGPPQKALRPHKRHAICYARARAVLLICAYALRCRTMYGMSRPAVLGALVATWVGFAWCSVRRGMGLLLAAVLAAELRALDNLLDCQMGRACAPELSKVFLGWLHFLFDNCPLLTYFTVNLSN